VEQNQKIFEDLLDNQQFKALREKLMEIEPFDVAQLLGNLPYEKAAVAFRILPKDFAVYVFEHLDAIQQQNLLNSLSDQNMQVLLEEMPLNDRVDLLEEVPAIVAKRLLQLLSPEKRAVTMQLLGYQEGTAGRIMNPFLVDLHTKMTVKQALDHIRKVAPEIKDIYESYVTDGQRHLVGNVPLKNVVLAEPETRISRIMMKEPQRVKTDTDQEKVAKLLRDYNLTAIPVVDSEERLVGIVTYDDVADIMEEEATEDIYRFGAIPGTEWGYFTSNILSIVKRRVVWLFLLVIVNTLTASIIASQSELLTEVLVLATFIPLLTGAGGNIGAQSATVVIRGIATGEISLGRAFIIVTREVGIGALMGIFLSIIVVGWAFFLGRDAMVAIAVSLSVVAIAVMATLAGSSLPLLLYLFKLDPALLSVPLITTIVDIFGLILYFFFAHLLLQL